MPRAPSKLHRIKRGLELPLAGAPERTVTIGPAVRHLALLATDYPGLKPRLRVSEGQRVRQGETLFEDRANQGVRFVSPGSGRVASIHRGQRRALRSVVIALDDVESDRGEDPRPLEPVSADQLRGLLLQSGLWTALRGRPWGGVARPSDSPRALFVTAADSRPHAPALEALLSGGEARFVRGLRALVLLADGAPLHLCLPEGAPALEPMEGVTRHSFAGPHPAGTVGLHIHRIAPADRGRTVWHIGCQDVLALGQLLRTGHAPVERVVSLAGPQARQPRLLATRLGASLDELCAGELRLGENRIISGSALDGRSAMGTQEGYLGRYHQQVSVLREGRERPFFGWMAPGLRQQSVHKLFLSSLLPRRPRSMSTAQHGELRNLVPCEAYERVWPFDIPPVALLRALLSGDGELAEDLGCLELVEEDLALLCHVCPSKNDYGAALRQLLRQLEKEG